MKHRYWGPIGRHAERGVVLFISLIVLVSMSLSGIALMRSVDAGLLVAGNLSFKRATTSAGDFGLEFARNWLMGVAAGSGGQAFLTAHNATTGYYADWVGPTALAAPSPYDWNPVNHAWDDNNASDEIPDGQGNRVRFVVHRLCAPGTAAVNAALCLTAAGGAAGSTMSGAHYGKHPLSGGVAAYYRITVRVQGPKNTVSFVQSVIF